MSDYSDALQLVQILQDVTKVTAQFADKLQPVTQTVEVPVEKIVEKPVSLPPTPEQILADKRQRVVDVALGLRGKVQYVSWKDRQEAVPPYKTDCSGFTYLVYKMAGVLVPFPDLKDFSRDDDQQATMGQEVPWGQFEKGDIICMTGASSTSPTDVGHVAIYIGDGNMIHNANSTVNVIISTVESHKDKHITTRRILS